MTEEEDGAAVFSRLLLGNLLPRQKTMATREWSVQKKVKGRLGSFLKAHRWIKGHTPG